ncbi:MAG: hypothetical protein ACLQDM_13565 [Bradyrhizobium sp.]
MRVIDKIAKSICRGMDGSDIVIGPMISRPSYDASMLIRYFDVATSGRKQYRSIRIDVENDNDRALLIAALRAMHPPLTIHEVDDELEMLRGCEALWPGERVTKIRQHVEDERQNEVHGEGR